MGTQSVVLMDGALQMVTPEFSAKFDSFSGSDMVAICTRGDVRLKFSELQLIRMSVDLESRVGEGEMIFVVFDREDDFFFLDGSLFDMELLYQNEYGAKARRMLHGCKCKVQEVGTSVDDMIHESTVTFTCCKVGRLENIS